MDAIHVGADAPTMPAAPVEQLVRPGRIFIPVGTYVQHILQVKKDENGKLNVTETPLLDVIVLLHCIRISKVHGAGIFA